MNYLTIAQVLWPALFALGVLQLYLFLGESGTPDRATLSAAVIAVVGLLLTLYYISPIKTAVRLLLTCVGFGAPLGLGVIAIQRLVEET